MCASNFALDRCHLSKNQAQVFYVFFFVNYLESKQKHKTFQTEPSGPADSIRISVFRVVPMFTQLDGRSLGGYHDSLLSMLDKERPLHDSVSIVTYYHKHAEISSKIFSALENEPLITTMHEGSCQSSGNSATGKHF